MNTKMHTSKHNIDLINNLNITSARLSLKKFSLAEVEYNVAHEMNTDIMRYIRDPMSIEDTRKKTMLAVPDWSGAEKDWVLFALRLTESDDYIGMVCMRYESIENDTLEIGWRLGSEHHGIGLATEAASLLLDFLKEQIKPHKVTAYCVAENTASSNIMLKLGMQQEACLRQFSRLGGQWFDEAIYGAILN
ncbi:MAG: GNAT family N-acetyltransferase [Alcanivoracaceae bacterium]|nr:GNAT family N-acetyltransferase [Alcanivoracaceae bacterium]